MNFRDFVQAAEGHLLRHGWARNSHNGVWPMFLKGARCTFPEALTRELWQSSEFDPEVERYLIESGWRRASQGVVIGRQLFARGDTYKTLCMALIEQLKLHRLDRAAVVPPTTPEAMKKILDVTQFRLTPVSR